MNLWLRLAWLLAARLLGRQWRREPFHPLTGVSRLGFRVWPHDLDTSVHMNNGRYLSLMDLGRTDWLIRTGLWRGVLRHRWTPILAAAQVRYRRELRPFQPFTIETRLLCWDARQAVMEQRFLIRQGGDSVVAARGLMLVGLYDRTSRAFVPMERLIAETGIDAVSPEPEADVAAFLAAQEASREALRRAA